MGKRVDIILSFETRCVQAAAMNRLQHSPVVRAVQMSRWRGWNCGCEVGCAFDHEAFQPARPPLYKACDQCGAADPTSHREWNAAQAWRAPCED